MTDIWIECLKNKYRFEFKGLINVEDLFDLKLEDLDLIYRELKKNEADLQGDSLFFCFLQSLHRFMPPARFLIPVFYRHAPFPDQGIKCRLLIMAIKI